MRRPTSAWTRAILGTALTASTLSAQQSPTVPDRGAESAPAAAPVTYGRGARNLIRNGWDYINFQEYQRALAYFREAEKQQGELSDKERNDLKKGIESALRGMRQTGVAPTTAYAKTDRGMRDEQVARAKSPAPAGRATAANSVQLVSGPVNEPQGGSLPSAAPPTLPAFPPQPLVTELPRDQADETPLPATDLAPGLITSPGGFEPRPREGKLASTTAAAGTTAPVVDLPPLPPEDPIGPKAVARSDDSAVTQAQAVSQASTEPAPSSSTIELSQPDSATVPVASLPAPTELSQPAEPAATAPAPTATPAGAPVPTPAASPAAPDQEPILLPSLSADPDAHPAGGTVDPPKTPSSSPPTGSEPSAPAAKDESLPPLPDISVPTPTPSPDAEKVASPDSPAPAAESLPVLPSDLSTNPSLKDSAPAPARAPAPAPETAAPAVLPASEGAAPAPGASAVSVPDPAPVDPPAVAAEAPAAVAAEAPSAVAAEAPADKAEATAPGGPRHPVTGLPPHLQREVDQIVLKQEEEARLREQNPAGVQQPTEAPPVAPGSAPPTRLEITRAPSPTEARPLRAIPIPEEFVPMSKREWAPNRKYWVASALCHPPLYFQDAALERYGHSTEQFFGPIGRYLSYPVDDVTQSTQRNQLIQPLFSIGLFAAQVLALPYNVLMDPPWEAEYDLGYYRPGDRIPTDLYYLPLHGVGPPLRGANY